MITLKCQTCFTEYNVSNYRKFISKYCSRSCHSKKSGVVGGKAGKGVSRNKGVKRPYLSERNKIVKMKGDKHPFWKGEKVGYMALHAWIYRNYGKANKCEKCLSEKSVQWANKTKKYRREREDWMQLCASCHRQYDNATRSVQGRFKNHQLVTN